MPRERRTTGSPLTEILSVRPPKDDPGMRDKIELAAELTGENSSDFMRRVVLEKTNQIIEEVGADTIVAELEARQQREHAARMERARATLASFGARQTVFDATEPNIGGTSEQSIGTQENARVKGQATRRHKGITK